MLEVKLRMYSIGALSRKSGVSVKAIRYYSNAGLLPPARTTEAGYRQYGDEELARLHQIAILRFLGASLHQIREVLANEEGLSGLLTVQACAVDAEIERLRRLRSAIVSAQLGISRQEEPWRHLHNLMEVMQMTTKDRTEWWGKHWRKRLEDQGLPAEFVDSFVRDLQSSVGHESTEVEREFMLAMQQGEKEDAFWAGLKERWTKTSGTGMDYGEWEARVREVFIRLHSLKGSDPGDPQVQSWVDEYFECTGQSLDTAAMQRLLDMVNQPIFRRMAEVADLTDPGNHGEELHQLIQEALRIRIQTLSSGTV